MSECSNMTHSGDVATEALCGSRIVSVVDPASAIHGWLDASGAEHIALWDERDRLTGDISRAATLRAHAAVIDLDQGTARALRLATMISPPCGVLFTAESIDAATCREINQLHWGYRSKHASQGDFLLALRRVARLCVPDPARLAAHGTQLWRLSPQQARLLYYNLWCYCDQDIADALAVSVHTVQEYQESLRKKTGARNKQAYFSRLLEVSGASPSGTSRSPSVRSAPGLAAAREEWSAKAELEHRALVNRRTLHD